MCRLAPWIGELDRQGGALEDTGSDPASSGRVWRPAEPWQVTAHGKIDADLSAILVLLVILSDTLPHLGGGDADHRIAVGVIVGRAAKDLNAEQPLLELRAVALQRMFDDVLQKSRITAAMAEVMTFQQTCELLLNLFRGDL